MSLALPKPIADYFEADRRNDAAAVARCFSEDAVAKDEGRVYTGTDAIRQWKAGASQKYSYTVEPFAIAVDGARTVVTGHLEGDFPGSPTDLRYFFVITDGKITELEIIP